MKKVIVYYIGDTVKDWEGNKDVVLLKREENKAGKLVGWYMWVGNSFINRKLKCITNYTSSDEKVNRKTVVFGTTKSAENFYKKYMKGPKGISEWKRE